MLSDCLKKKYCLAVHQNRGILMIIGNAFRHIISKLLVYCKKANILPSIIS